MNDSRASSSINTRNTSIATERMERRPSANNTMRTAGGASSAASSGSAAKKSRARDLLRDYYSLPNPGGEKPPAPGNPLDMDSPAFSTNKYIENLLNTALLSQLLRTSTELSSSISDLETERQALVYNHHHELIDASVTISKMKVRAESLDTTLEQLKAGLAKCSELDEELRAKPSGLPASPVSDSSGKDPNWHAVLDTMLDLPLTMQAASKEEAQRLWGTYEPVLRKWKDAGVQGIADVESDCRDVLNAKTGGEDLLAASARRRSGSVATLRP